MVCKIWLRQKHHNFFVYKDFSVFSTELNTRDLLLSNDIKLCVFTPIFIFEGDDDFLVESPSIPFVFLHHIPETKLHLLLSFFNYIWQTGFPLQWHETLVVPVLKAGKAAVNPESCRPIALTNCLCKTMEKWSHGAFRDF